MKHIYLNLKRFDVPVEFGGVNRLASVADWASCIVKNTQEELKKYDSEDIFVIGGESIYRQLLDECDKAYITKIEYAYTADAYFPNLDEKEEWKITAESEEHTCFDLEYFFLIYEKNA